MIDDIVIPLTVSTDSDVGLVVSDDGNIPMTMDTAIRPAIMPHYDGPVDISPGDAPVVIATAGTVVDENIVIEAVPDTYGHIAWNGAELMVY